METTLSKWNPFVEALKNGKPLLLDGAMGSYLQQKGFETDENLWTTKINFSNPDAIIELHSEYIDSGANIITTNTFRTNPASLGASRVTDCEDYVKQAVMLAQEASKNHDIFIAGSNAPAEDCYQVKRTLSKQKLELNHKKHIDLLKDNQVDFILNETQSHFDEIQIICEYCEGNEIPYVISLYFTDSLNILSGESLSYVFSYLKDFNPLGVGVNCISPEPFLKLIGSTHLPQYWGFYLNCGSGNPTDKNITCGIQPNGYLKYVKKSIEYSPSFIGTCCGSNPSHIKKLRDFLDGRISS